MTDSAKTASDDDLRAVLAEVAVDRKAPAHARVSAARALMRGKPKQSAEPTEAEAEQLHPAVAWLEAWRARASDAIPTKARHRGLGLHDRQTATRLAIVRRAVDAVLAMEGHARLAAFVRDASQPPEARLLAWARLEVAWENAAASRSRRPIVDLDVVRATALGLDSARWRDPLRFTSLLDPDPPAGEGKRAARRPRPIEVPA